ncbi:hypothetical protein [Saliphagus sp. LR7]|uniref:hypothetical protein n=1 Tax=Saliphagus sp. LR7 TaxID=2282654 RepID=UPI001E4E3730|nr:hypothetical protein [Saliphagus sp. LR7]
MRGDSGEIWPGGDPSERVGSECNREDEKPNPDPVRPESAPNQRAPDPLDIEIVNR